MDEQKQQKNYQISRDDVVDAIARQVINDHINDDDLKSDVNRIVDEYVTKRLSALLDEKINEVLTSTLHEFMNKPIANVDMFGDPIGDQKTIKETLWEKAHDFWSERVDEKGNVVTSNGLFGIPKNTKTRAEFLLAQMVDTQFMAVTKNHVDEIVQAFKAKLELDKHTEISEHIRNLFK